MSQSPQTPAETAPRSTETPASRAGLAERLGPARDQLEIKARDGWRLAREKTAIAATAGRAQLDRAQSFVSFHARRRPLLTTGIAAGVGLLAALVVARRPKPRRSA